MKTLKYILLACTSVFILQTANAQGVKYQRDLSPAEGLITPQEKPYREEICLNGYWELQPVALPAGWKQGTGVPPELTKPVAGKWDPTRIKIPSAINVNDWGRGLKVGEGTNSPYAPSTVYFPSYPEHWSNTRMAWLRKNISIPTSWTGKRLIVHFEAVAGECVVYLNGKEAGKNFDSHLPFEVDITDYVAATGTNELLLGVRHSKLFDKSHPEYTKFGATYPHGSNTDDLIGIWQDVFLFAVPEIRVGTVFVKSWLDKDELELEVQVINQSNKKRKVSLNGDIKEWINKANQKNELLAAEISWELGNTALTVSSEAIDLQAGETKTVTIRTKVNGSLKKWSPDAPDLYTLLLNVKEKKNVYDCQATRFGWRQFTISGSDFLLNGEKIQCFGDIQHPFSAYICSRRFAWAWYRMIKDFGGNAVRPHAQPWPRVYYDLADEMGLMVLDETALFGSSIRLNLEEDITWQRTYEHLGRLIQRDRNHPSVVGWSAGNEMFAIALLNKPSKEVAAKWDDKLAELALSIKKLDPTRAFITLDGDRDMDGRLPVWSKHFGHGLRTGDLPQGLNKPLIVGESGATYYGKPIQLYPFAGDKAFESYYGRSEALAIDAYQNAVEMAKPYLAYYSPSEVCWFGIEHMNLGYHDYSRLPNLRDGIFAGKPYEEGKPGYQYERIPPYVTTFNPGLDPNLPLYKPLPMFEALKAALSKSTPQPCAWDKFTEILPPAKPGLPAEKYQKSYFIGKDDSQLKEHLIKTGVQFVSGKETSNLIIIDAASIKTVDILNAKKTIDRIKKDGGLILVMLHDKAISPAVNDFLPEKMEITAREATAMEYGKDTAWKKYFGLPDLYFAEMEGDRKIQKVGLAGEFVKQGSVIFTASRTDWSLFNSNPENRKCAQVVLYEHLIKPEGAALVSHPLEKGEIVLSAIDYTLDTKETAAFWKNFYPVLGIGLYDSDNGKASNKKTEHDLLLDGPVD
ncbi:glycoside hydrolase family 2 protein [Viscerimonas tarda]